MNIRNTKRQMPETKKKCTEETLKYNEKELSLKKIIFDPRQFLDPCQNFMDPLHPHQNSNVLYFFVSMPKVLWTHVKPTPFFWPASKFYGPIPSTLPSQKFDINHPQTNSPMLTTPFTHPRYTRYLAGFVSDHKS